MIRESELFMEALGAALKNEAVCWGGEVSAEALLSVLKIAQAHRVLPMVYQAVCHTAAAGQADPDQMRGYRRSTMQMVMLQTRRTAEFLPLLERLRAAGAEPLVVKGITCRMLYPNPDHRLSSDEDVLIPPEKFEICHQILTEYGLTAPDPEDPHEVAYRGVNSSLYLEIHKSLFPEGNVAYGDLNRYFADIRQRAVVQNGVPTLCPTDHMLYLIFHAFKHFLHSGFGIRQVCDMMLYANTWGPEIDWLTILEQCRKIRAEQFAAGLFRIGRKYLHFSPETAGYPAQWQAIYVDERPLLEDILQSGIYGSTEKSRQHSSNITLNAVISQKQGKRRSGGVMKTLFPSAKDLQRRYPYLKENKLLLPVAWADRIMKYGKESAGKADNSAADSLRIGKERVDLLKRYGILDKR